jgi:hypothetical protein
MKTIQLSQGYETVVDDDVWERFKDADWHTVFSKGGKPYALGNQYGLLHRAIFLFIDGVELGKKQVDHKDRNGLNNLRSNLRIVTPKENPRNNSRRAESKNSPYIGVTWKPHAGAWRAQTRYNKEHIFLGYYSTAEEAGMAYDRAVLYYYGDSDVLNFPERKHEHDLSAPYERKYKTLKSTNKTGYRGVNQRGRKFYAGIGVGGRDNQKKIHLGSFDTPEEAARMYDAYVIENNLPNPLNFPEE